MFILIHAANLQNLFQLKCMNIKKTLLKDCNVFKLLLKSSKPFLLT